MLIMRWPDFIADFSESRNQSDFIRVQESEIQRSFRE